MSTGTAPKAVVAVSRTMKLKIMVYFKIFSFCYHFGRSLRKYQHTVRANGKHSLERKSVVLTRFGDDIGARMSLEVVAVTLPIAVKPELPDSCGREANDVAFLRLMSEVCDNHYVVCQSAFVPTVEGNDLSFIVKVTDLGELPAEAASKTVTIEPQPDEIAVQPNDAVKLVALIPVNRDRIAEPSSFEKFLTLEKQGDPGSRKDHGCGQRRTFPCIPPLRVIRADLLRHALPPVCHLVVRFAVNDPVEGVIVVAVAERIADSGE